MLVNCPSCNEEIEIPRCVGAQAPKLSIPAIRQKGESGEKCGPPDEAPRNAIQTVGSTIVDTENPKQLKAQLKITTGFEVSDGAPLFTHLDTIGQLVAARENAEKENSVMPVAGGETSFGMGFAAGPLHNDVFGHVYSGTSPFSVGKLDHAPGHAGTLHTDHFGNIYSGDSHLPVGHTPTTPAEPGVLHTDEFGNVYPGQSHFPVDHINP